MKMKNFSSKAVYKKWLAFGHIHGQFKKKRGHQRIKIRRKLHRVKHSIP